MLLARTTVLVCAASLRAAGAELSETTARGFRAYIQRQELAMQSPKPRWDELPAGRVRVEHWNPSPTVDVEDGLIHDWVAGYFAPGVTADGIRSVLAQYDRYPDIYSPEVLKAEVLTPRNGMRRLQMRVVKKKILTVVLDTEYEVESLKVRPTTFVSRSRSSRIWEVENAGEPGERRREPGTGYGFLWALNSYWYIEDRAGGVYVECRAVSLTRNVPRGLGWAIKPMITSLPRESLEKTLLDTVRAASR